MSFIKKILLLIIITNKLVFGQLPCGTIMASFKGIYAYSNGLYQGTMKSCAGTGNTGLLYQCAELVQRYTNILFNISPNWKGIKYASEMCNTYPFGILQTNNPKSGDIVVFDGIPGHVAIIIFIVDNILAVIEQNGNINGYNYYNLDNALCFLTVYK